MILFLQLQASPKVRWQHLKTIERFIIRDLCHPQMLWSCIMFKVVTGSLISKRKFVDNKEEDHTPRWSKEALEVCKLWVECITHRSMRHRQPTYPCKLNNVPYQLWRWRPMIGNKSLRDLHLTKALKLWLLQIAIDAVDPTSVQMSLASCHRCTYTRDAHQVTINPTIPSQSKMLHQRRSRTQERLPKVITKTT